MFGGIFCWTADLYKLSNIIFSLYKIFLFKLVINIFWLKSLVSKSFVRYIFSVFEILNTNSLTMLFFWSIVKCIFWSVFKTFKFTFFDNFFFIVIISSFFIPYCLSILSKVSPNSTLWDIFLNLGSNLLKIWLRVFLK